MAGLVIRIPRQRYSTLTCEEAGVTCCCIVAQDCLFDLLGTDGLRSPSSGSQGICGNPRIDADAY